MTATPRNDDNGSGTHTMDSKQTQADAPTQIAARTDQAMGRWLKGVYPVSTVKHPAGGGEGGSHREAREPR